MDLLRAPRWHREMVPYPFLPSLPASRVKGRLIGLPLRATFSPAHPLARRDVPVTRARALQFAKPLFREWPRLPFTARIERAQFHRARSASKKGTWPLPPHPSEAARCASKGDGQATPSSFAASEGCEGAGRPFFLLAEPPR